MDGHDSPATETPADRWPESVGREAVAHLPPERDDEPHSLRQEILDELTDHLACAFRRELLRTGGDAATAVRNVRQAFGDPARIARRLWLDAMKGKLMAQKLLIGTSGLLAAVVVVLVFFGWQLVETNRRATAALLAQSRDAQAALLDRLAAIEGRPAWSGTPEWNPFVLKFVTDAPGSPPATDVRVTVTGPTGTGGDFHFPYEERRTGKDGLIDLGPAKVGQYHVVAQTAWGEKLEQTLTMMPGRPLEETVVVPPAEPPPTASASFGVEWPESLKADAPWAVLTFAQSSYRNVADRQWEIRTPQVVAFHGDGRVVDLLAHYRDAPPTRQSSPGEMHWDLIAQAAAPRTGFKETWPGTASVWWVTLWPEQDLPEDPNRLFRRGVTMRYGTREFDGSYFDLSKTAPLVLGGLGGFGGLNGGFGGGLNTAPGFEVYFSPPSFTLAAGEDNRWSIAIPEPLISKFRETREAEATKAADET